LIEGAPPGQAWVIAFYVTLSDQVAAAFDRCVLFYSGRETVADYQTVNRELASYNPALAIRPQIVVATKIDALDEPERLESLRLQTEEDGPAVFRHFCGNQRRCSGAPECRGGKAE